MVEMETAYRKGWAERTRPRGKYLGADEKAVKVKHRQTDADSCFDAKQRKATPRQGHVNRKNACKKEYELLDVFPRPAARSRRRLARCRLIAGRRAPRVGRTASRTPAGRQPGTVGVPALWPVL